MAFTRTKYEANDGEIHPMRLNSLSVGSAGTLPAGVISNRIPAKVTKGNREFGLRPRGVRLVRTVGTAPNTFTRSAFLPLRSIVDADAPAYKEFEQITINTVVWTVGAFVPEDVS